ncbi:MAG: glycosyltransferase family 4 protein [Fidelibacterota bacterium]
MKILLINHEFPPNGGGAATITQELYKRLKQHNHKVHLLTGAVDQKNEDMTTVLTGRKAASKGSVNEFLLFIVKGFLKLKSVNRSFSPEVVLAFFTIPGGFLAMGYKFLFKVPYIVSLRGGDVPGFQLGGRYKRFQTFARPFIKMVCKHAAVVHVNSRRLAYLAGQTGIHSGKIRMLPNGITIREMPARNNLPKGKIKFLYTGRLSEQKNLGVFIKALALLQKDFQFKLIGDGPCKAHLQSLVRKKGLAEKVIFDTWKNREALDRQYREAHIFVLPSLDEGMSNSALEAVANQCALLSSANAHLQWEDETIKRNWVVSDYRNPIAWKEKLQYLLENPALINESSQQMRKFIVRNNNWDNLYPKYEEMLKQCVG